MGFETREFVGTRCTDHFQSRREWQVDFGKRRFSRTAGISRRYAITDDITGQQIVGRRDLELLVAQFHPNRKADGAAAYLAHFTAQFGVSEILGDLAIIALRREQGVE